MTTTTTALPEWLQSMQRTAADRGLALSNQPYTPYHQQMVAGFSPEQEAAMQLSAARATSGSPLMNQAQGLLGQTMGGGMATQNPYLEGQISQAADLVQNRMGQMGYQSGSFGNTGVMDATARALADTSNTARYKNWQDERQNQLQAMQLAPQFARAAYDDASALYDVGAKRQALNQDVLGANYKEFLRAQEYPYHAQNALLGSLGLGNVGSTTTQSSPMPQRNALAGALGGGLAGYQIGNMIGGEDVFGSGLSGGTIGAGLGLLSSFF